MRTFKNWKVNFFRFSIVCHALRLLNNKFLILNDIGDKFYKYYVVPNDSQKLQLGDFSDQFKVSDKVNIKLQRLEGCTKAYPCYELDFE